MSKENIGNILLKKSYALKKAKLLTYVYMVAMTLFNCANVNAEPCVGKFVNPITDICWSCIFPIKIGNIPIYSGGREDTNNPSTIPCLCMKNILGVPTPVPGRSEERR